MSPSESELSTHNTTAVSLKTLNSLDDHNNIVSQTVVKHVVHFQSSDQEPIDNHNQASHAAPEYINSHGLVEPSMTKEKEHEIELEQFLDNVSYMYAQSNVNIVQRWLIY